MYIPGHFKVKDEAEVWEFLRANGFGILVTTVNNQATATHIPFQLREKEGVKYLTSHMALGNQQWKDFAENNQVLVIFGGPHAYISSSWYEEENVPTWNYQSVHIYGEVTVMDEEELRDDLTSLLQKYEGHRENGVLWENTSPELLERQMKGVVGFTIKINDILAAYKLSQNRNKTDYQNIINELHKEPGHDSKQMAAILADRQGDEKDL